MNSSKIVAIITFSIFIFCFSLSIHTLSQTENDLSKKSFSSDTTLINKVNYLIVSGTDFWKKNYYDSAFIDLNEALDISVNIDNKELKSQCLFNIGLIYYSKGEYLTSLEYYMKAYQITSSLNDKYKHALRAHNIGLVYKKQGIYDKAIQYYLEAARLFDKTNKKKELSSCYNSIAGIQNKLKNYKESLNYHHKALNLRKEINHTKGVASSLNNIGNVYLNIDSISKAISYCKKSLSIKMEIGNENSIAYSHYNIGNIYFRNRQYMHAIDSYTDALNLFKKTKDINGEINISIALGKVYFQKKDFIEAESLLNTGYHVAEIHNDLDATLESLNYLKDLYYKINDYESSIHYHKKYDQIKDSILNIEKTNSVNRLKIKYETEKKDQIISSQQKLVIVKDELISAQAQTNLILWISSSILAILLTILFFAFRKIKKNNREIKENNKQIKTLKKDKEHRTKNNLQIIINVLNLQARKAKNLFVKEALYKAMNRVESVMLNENLLNNSSSMNISVNDYIEQLTCNLINTHCPEKNINLNLNIEDLQIEAETMTSIGLILNELITNSLKYAFLNHPNPVITISILEKENSVRIIKIADNGPGYSNRSPREDSVGLELIDLLTNQIDGKLVTNINNGVYNTITFK